MINTINRNKKLKFIKDNWIFVYLFLIAILIIDDYYVFTNVFSLNQSIFFNFILKSFEAYPFFLFFVVIPIFLILIFIYIFWVKYSILNKIKVKNYAYKISFYLYSYLMIGCNHPWIKQNINFMKYFSIVILFISFLFFLISDFLVLSILYFFNTYLKLDLSQIIILTISLGSYFIINLILIYFLYSLFYFFRKSKSNFHFLSGFTLGVLSGIKLVCIFLFANKFGLPIEINILVLINLIIFSFMIILLNSDKKIVLKRNRNNNVKERYFKKYLFSTLLIVINFIFFIKMWESGNSLVFKSKAFWEEKVDKNSLFISSATLFFNPLKITKLQDEIEYITIKENVGNEEMNEFKNYPQYYIPFDKDKLIFIYLKDLNKVFVLYLQNNQKVLGFSSFMLEENIK